MKINVEEDIVIDNVDYMLREIRKLSGMKVREVEVIVKFIGSEPGTKYYVDNKMYTSTADYDDARFLWLDTGYIDQYGKPIFVSLLKRGSGVYEGHRTGTFKTLLAQLRDNNRSNIKYINANGNKFESKYAKKTSGRSMMHIEDEEKYSVTICNKESANGFNNMSALLNDISKNVRFSNTTGEADGGKTISEKEKWEKEKEDKDRRQEEERRLAEEQEAKKILRDNLDYLYAELLKEQKLRNEQFKHIQEFQMEIDRLSKEVSRLKNENVETTTYYQEIVKKYEKEVAEREKVLRSINEQRTNDSISISPDRQARDEEDALHEGHNLLGANKQLLVVGETHLGDNVLYALAAEYGFYKKDVVLLTDYDDVKSRGACTSRKFSAAIIGACPHSVRDKGDWNSLVEKYKYEYTFLVTADARTKSNQLKITKESFRVALGEIINMLKEKALCNM